MEPFGNNRFKKTDQHKPCMEDITATIRRLRENDPIIESLSLSKKGLGEHLDVLADLADALANNTKLKTLDLSYNKIRDKGIKYLRLIIASNTSITDLDISFNYISPCGITNSTPFMLGNTTLTKIHIEEYVAKGTISALKAMSCPHVALVRRNIVAIADQNKKILQCCEGSRQSLHLSGRNLSFIPPRLIEARRLQELDLSQNSITSLSEEFFLNLTNLTSLNLSYNKIREILPSIGNMTNLTSLNLESNLLSQLPFQIANLPLQTLNLLRNLFYSPYLFPYYTLKTKQTMLEISDKDTKIAPLANIPFVRLFFIGERNSRYDAKLYGLTLSEAHKLIQNVKLTQLENSFRFLSKEDSSIVTKEKLLEDTTIQYDDMVIGDTKRKKSILIESPKDLALSNFIPNAQILHISSYMLDPVFEHAHRIVLSGRTNYAPIVITFHLTNDVSSMVASITKRIHSTLVFHCHSPLYIVGTYQKGFEKSEKRQIQKILQEEIAGHFTGLKFSLFLVDLRTGGKGSQKFVKELLGSIWHGVGDFRAPFPFLHASCSLSWYLEHADRLHRLAEHLKIQAEIAKSSTDNKTKYSKLIIPWNDFVALAESFDIPKLHCEKTIIFLRQIGAIFHFRDAQLPFTDNMSLCESIFLSSEIIFRCYNALLRNNGEQHRLHPRSGLFAFSVDCLGKIWSFFDKSLHICMLYLLLHCELVFSINEENFFVNSIFPPRTEMQSLETLPNCYLSENNDPQVTTIASISRCFTLKQMTPIHFDSLLCAIHLHITTAQLVHETKLTTIFEDTIELQEESTDGEVIAVAKISFHYALGGILLVVKEEDKSKSFFCMLAELIDGILKSNNDFVRGDPPVKAVCVCSACSQQDRIKPCSLVAMECIENTAAAGKAFLYCSGHALRIDLVAPDITLSNLQHITVDYDELQIHKEVGKGSFASVFYGIYHENQEVAIKKLKNNLEPSIVSSSSTSSSSVEIFSEFRQEVSLMAGLQHPNTVGLLGLCTKPLCVLTEFCPYGDLFSYLDSRRERNAPLPLDFALNILLDVAKGMEFLHTATPPILHRDLKSPNILLCRICPDEAELENPFPVPSFLIPGHKDPEEIAKVADFGLSLRTLGPLTERVVENPIWLAPELVAKQMYSFASDVYAFGIIMNEVLTLQRPFTDLEYSFMFQLEDKILEGARPTIPDYVNKELKLLMTQCWAHDQKMRPSFTCIITKLQQVLAEHLLVPTLDF